MRWMRTILTGCHKLLAPSGSLYLHIDWRMSAKLRLMLDNIFGQDNFMDEIIWGYKSGGRATRFFPRKHDTILFYRKSRRVYFNIAAVGQPRGPERRNHMKQFVDPEGRIGYSIRTNGKVYTYYEDDPIYPTDVWTDIEHLQQKDKERLGYATQKPMELMRRIIDAGSEEGDLVGDFFCGSGSFLEAAQLSGRRWMGCDNEKLAVSMARKRLMKREAAFRSYDLSTEGSAGRIDVTIRDEQHLERGGRLIRAAVTDFVPDIDTGYIQTRDRQYIEDAMKDDPMQLIDYIMIDNDFSGEFRCRNIIEEPEEEFTVITQGNAAVIAVDVFGREYDGGII